MDEERTPGQGGSLGTRLGTEDPRLEQITELLALSACLPKRPDGERNINKLYFFDCLTQRQVADAIGVSRMHVSRLLNRSCTFLRHRLLSD
ncbi:sigma factor-like helix-turn-helix DNA-binding protein [Streptomyces sp. MAI_2237]